jgi:3-methyladenine DNA glycosylase AlkD
MNSNTEELRNVINDLFWEASIEEDREQMMAYMKNNFDFYGVKAPARREILSQIKPSLNRLDREEIFTLAEALWEEPYRESQYIGIDILVLKHKYWDVDHLTRIEKLITTKSWWDTVDSLAPNIAGRIFTKDTVVKMEWIEKWNYSDNMWLNRSALIHQLRYKENTNLDLLFALVESHQESKEFFINKASGWALRQASKFYPSEVRTFIDDYPGLSKLTIREGTKYL